MNEHLEFLEDVKSRLRIGHVSARNQSRRRPGSQTVSRLGRGAAVVVDDQWPLWKRQLVTHVARTLWQAEVTPDSVVVLESAGLMWGLPVLHPGESVHLTRLHSRHRRSYDPGSSLPERSGRPAVIRHAITLAESEWTTIMGVRVCTLDRLVFDVARLRGPRSSLPLIDGALARSSTADRRDRAGTLARAQPIRNAWVRRAEDTRAVRGIRKARAILPFADPFSEAIGESSTRWALLALGLPVPVAQYEIPLGDGTSYYPDLYIEELNLIVEFDGAVKFEGPDGPARRAAHLRRHERLVQLGYRVVHLTWSDILTAGALFEALARHIGMDILAGYDARLELLEPGFLS